MQTFSPRPEHVQWGFYDARQPPVGEVQSGETFRLQSTSGLAWDPEPDRYLPAEALAIHRQVTDKGPGAHILTGPISVVGASPGDVLQIDVLDVRLRSPFGYSNLDPLKGIYTRRVEHPTRWMIPIDLDSGRIEVLPGVWADSAPFFGNIGVAPPPGFGRIGSAEPRVHGGNIDLKELGRGTTLFLPVHVAGALLSIGDGHGLQGDGEVSLSAVETPLEGEFRVTVRRDLSTVYPLVVTPTHFITLAFHEDLDEAARLALGSMLEVLERECDLPFNDGLRMASFCVDLHITQVVNIQKGVHAMISRSILQQLPSLPNCLRQPPR
ncbi:MAG: acetamidase/formamidase family protein [Candidatus Dormibacteraceae bacterium]